MFRFLFFTPNRNFYLLVGLLVALVLIFALPLVSLAQDTSAPVIPPDVLPVGEAGSQLFAFILNMLVPFAASPLTTTLVAVAKLFIPDSISAGVIKNVIAAILTVLYWVAVRYNFQDTFASIGQFLVTAVPAAFLLFKTFVDSSRIHEDAVKSNFRLLGYKRT